NEIAAVQKVFQQRFVIGGKRRCLCCCGEKLYRSLSRCRKPVLLRHVTPENVGRTNTELIRAHSLDFGANLFEFLESDFAWRLWRQFWFPPLRKPPHNQTEQRQDNKRDHKNKPRRDQRIIHRWRDIMELFSEHEPRGSDGVME